jgi:hypothetical protein
MHGMWWAALLNSFAAVLDSGGAGGAGGSFESIATATGTGSSGTITFSSIPSTYQHLQIRIMARTDRSSTESGFQIRFNSDSGSNYVGHQILGFGTTIIANGSTSQTQIDIGIVAAASAPSNTMGVGIIDVHDYASSTKNKTVRSLSGEEQNSADSYLTLRSGLWLNTNAINSITIIPNTANNFTTASVFALYGIKGA